MDISKDFLTTGEVASLFSVAPDTALRWAKNGKIPAIRTPGGHYRIYRSKLLSTISEKITQDEDPPTSIQYCWEFHSKSGKNQEGCKNCAVYRVKAIRCYEMLKLSNDIGHARLHCTSFCHECDYFKSITAN